MGEYREPTTESRGDVSAVFDAVDNLSYASSLPAPLFRVALATAAAREILNENPMPFPDAENDGEIMNRDTAAGNAARAAVHHLMRQDVSKYGNVAIMAGTIMSHMNTQCDAQRLLCGVDRPGYADNLSLDARAVVEILKTDPAERAEMELQATGDFQKMTDHNQRQILGDSISDTLVFMHSDKNFTQKLDGIALSFTEDTVAYTPAVLAQAAKENRINSDESIAPPRGHEVQSVYQGRDLSAQHAAAASAFGR